MEILKLLSIYTDFNIERKHSQTKFDLNNIFLIHYLKHID